MTYEPSTWEAEARGPQSFKARQGYIASPFLTKVREITKYPPPKKKDQNRQKTAAKTSREPGVASTKEA